ncbi:hypothetical protein OIU77_027301 [Salix suchowensis]|uniref:Uncharacterized protein n=1 Tax=Salix suchowensis TaxID=1278906 RepID=A0ABQ9BT15_9ROSI|nr:hypothetical protein OIU77_027301 [Salix suchowensis]
MPARNAILQKRSVEVDPLGDGCVAADKICFDGLTLTVRSSHSTALPRSNSARDKKQLARSASHGERVIESLPSDRQSSSYYRQHRATDVKMENGPRAGDGEEMTGRRKKLRKRKRDRERGRELPRYLGLWFMSSSISYILRKSRAFYNEFCCDNYFDDSSSAMGHEMMLADPYFSFPSDSTPEDRIHCVITLIKAVLGNGGGENQPN